MREDRVLRVLRPSLALAVLAAVVLLLGLVIAGPARAATSTPSPAPDPSGAAVQQREDLVRFGEDVVVSKDTQVPMVVAFGGDITVNGTVADSVVAFGGYVVINGTVGKSVVAFGGDVKLGPNAIVGSDIAPTDSSLVLMGGELTKAPGAQVTGRTETFEGIDWNGAGAWAARAWLENRLWGFSFVGWLVQTALFLVLALVAAALMPRQLRGVHLHLGRKPWASLGWGALLFFVVVPAVLVVLVISIVGLLLVVPYGLFVLLAYFFVTTGVASFLAQKVLTGFGGRENLMLAVTIGVLGTTVVSRIPIAGPLLVAVMTIFGAGAAVLGVAEWRRGKREAAAALAAANAAAAAAQQGAAAYPGAAPHQGAPATAAAPAAVITPIVHTAPETPVGAPPAPSPAPTSTMSAEAVTTVTAPGTAVTEAQTAVTAGEAVVEAPTAPESPTKPAAPAEPEAPVAPAGPAEAVPESSAPEPAAPDAGEPAVEGSGATDPAGEAREGENPGPAPM